MRSRRHSARHARQRSESRPGYSQPSLPGSQLVTLAAAIGVAMVGILAGVAVAKVATGPAGNSPSLPSAIGASRSITPAKAQGQPGQSGQATQATQPGQEDPPKTTAHPIAKAAHVNTTRTSCRSVAHIGDSTSVDLVSPDDIPDQAQRLAAQYADVGVKNLKIDASGGRSIVETLPGQVNGYNVALAWRAQGYRGCWVFALGTNDAANISIGSSMDAAARINEMMSVADGEPVMWVNVITALQDGAWSNANEQAWNNALVQALHQYPNMRIFDWAAVAQPSWFLPDGVHYNSLGCVMRAKLIAQALAKAFPVNGHSNGQIVR
jgi:hypothetical protein